MSYIMGIDPGKSGGVAVLSHKGEVQAVYKFADKTLTDIYELFLYFDMRFSFFCFIENVHAMPKQGVTSTFSFGKQYGGLLMLLICFKIPYEKISPIKWQRALSCLSGGDKNVTKAKAQELFPNQKIIHATADALLIAEYGRRIKCCLQAG